MVVVHLHLYFAFEGALGLALSVDRAQHQVVQMILSRMVATSIVGCLIVLSSDP